MVCNDLNCYILIFKDLHPDRAVFLIQSRKLNDSELFQKWENKINSFGELNATFAHSSP